MRRCGREFNVPKDVSLAKPGRARAAVSKSQGETMNGIRENMESHREAMLQRCRTARRQDPLRVLPGSASRSSTIAGVA